MTKVNFKKFFVLILTCFMCILSIFSFSACSDEKGKEITTEYAFAKLEEQDKKGVSRREKLINSYEDYQYIELEIHFYNEETFELEKITEICVRNVHEEEDGIIKKIDMQAYIEEYEVATKVTTYTLLKRQLNHVEMYTSTLSNNELTKEPAKVYEISTFDDFLNGFFAEFYKPEYLPLTEDVIEKAYKKTFSTDVNRVQSIEILFKNGDVYNEVSFNYETDKIHFVREYDGEKNLLREIEYTYSGNLVTGVKDIDYKKFDMHETCSPSEPVIENEVPSTCNVKGTYDEVIYCCICDEEISRESKEMETFAEHIDENEDTICDVCHNNADAAVSDIYYVNFVDAVTAAQTGDVITLFADITLTEGIVVPAGKTITLDLNGYTISGTCNASQTSMILVENTAKLSIKDSSEDFTGKITYAGNNSTGWIVAVQGNFVLESGTLELTGTWDIGYAVDVRPNAWGSDYTTATTFTMNGGKIISSDGAVRVASSSYDNYTGVSASFTMNGGYINATWDGIFVQQSNAAWDVLSVEINDGTIESDLNPIRFYGPAATSYVNGKNCVKITLNGGTLRYTGEEEQSWLVEGILRLGGGVTLDEFLNDAAVTANESLASSNVADGYTWIKSEDDYVLMPNTNIA